MKKIFTLFLSLLMGLSLFAQTPELLNYQAVVRDGSGNILANKLVSFRISIRQNSTSGTVVYQETHSPTTSALGLVDYAIGGGAVVSGDFTTIDWGADTYFVQVELDENGGSSYTSLGTQQLLSVPFALFAKDVANKDDADADPANEIQTLSRNGNTLTLSAGGGDVALSDGDITDVVAGNGLSGGAANGSATLDLGGALSDSLTLTLGNFNVDINLSNFGDFAIQDAGVDVFRVESIGTIGIGDDMIFRDGDALAGTRLVEIEDTGDDGRIYVYRNDGVQISLNGGGTTVFNEQGESVDFRIESINNTNAFYVDASENNVGVGTPSLDRNFHVRHDQFTQTGGFGGLEIEQVLTGNQWTLYTSQSTSNLRLYYNNLERGDFNDVTGNYASVSDERLKKNIESIGLTMPHIMQLRPTVYHFRTQEDNESKNPGFIAQEVREIFPEVVQVQGDDSNGNSL
ncbi:MAG: tail fiber domain-containing protein, partial [Bacteroidota bacterium]